MDFVSSLTIGVHLVTGHAAGGFESVTPGLYVRHDNGFTAGVLRNSERGTSVYAGKTWAYKPEENVLNVTEAAVTVGGITGYEGAAVQPMVIPSLRFGEYTRLSYIPKPPLHPNASPALHVSLERHF